MSVASRQSRFLTLDQVAEDLQLSRRTVERLVAAEIMPSVSIGGSRRVSADELDDWIAETTVGGSAANAVGRSSVDAGGFSSLPRPYPAAHVRDPDPAGSRSRAQRAGEQR
jgi:excisionase family DNA binding protein